MTRWMACRVRNVRRKPPAYPAWMAVPGVVLWTAFLCLGCQRPQDGPSSSSGQQFQVVGEAPTCCETPARATSEQPVDKLISAEADGGTASAVQAELLEKGGRTVAIKLSSPAFQSGKPIPKKYTGEGEDLSPPLEWSGLPEGTQELALICDDPDAPSPEPWVHWVIYKIPLNVTKLPEGIPSTPRLSDPPGAVQGKNSWTSGKTIGYRGPMPPPGHGRHRYYFRLYALDSKLEMEPGATKKQLLAAMQGHILGQGELVGVYERK